MCTFEGIIFNYCLYLSVAKYVLTDNIDFSENFRPPRSPEFVLPYNPESGLNTL